MLKQKNNWRLRRNIWIKLEDNIFPFPKDPGSLSGFFILNGTMQRFLFYKNQYECGSMRLQKIFLFLFLSPLVLFSQEDTTLLKKEGSNKQVDSSKKKLIITPQIPPRSLIIKLKDLNEIKKLKEKSFIIIDDTAGYSDEELASGLSEKELTDYKKNKKELKELLVLPPPEEETYPEVSTIRKILGVAKTAGVIIILILSFL